MVFEFPSKPALETLRRSLPGLLRNTADPFVRPWSKTLAQALRFTVVKADEQSLRLVGATGYWWAGVLDQGRKAVYPKVKEVLVWFLDIRDDPRVRGGTKYPKTYEGARRLTKAEYLNGLEQNRINRAAGLPPYMIVRPWPGQSASKGFSGPFEGRKFSDLASPALSQALTEEVTAVLVADVREQLRKELRAAFGL